MLAGINVPAEASGSTGGQVAPVLGSGVTKNRFDPVIGNGRNGPRSSDLPGLGEFDFDPQFDLAQHGVENRIA